jgi:hypothetical protein
VNPQGRDQPQKKTQSHDKPPYRVNNPQKKKRRRREQRKIRRKKGRKGEQKLRSVNAQQTELHTLRSNENFSSS